MFVCGGRCRSWQLGSVGPRAVFAPGWLPSLPVQEESLKSAPGPDLEGLGVLMPVESVFFPLRTDAALAHTQGCKQLAQMPGPPLSISRPLRSLGSDSSHPPGTSLVLTLSPQPLSPNS